MARPAAVKLLQGALDQRQEDLCDYLWASANDDAVSGDEKDMVTLMRLVLADFWANTTKPEYPRATNDRTPFAESIIPLFK
ncbi:hypothetical protein BC940DRAFT_232931 [Gongronella butleri]|nr:hypothetical protein BC940DRAFT_232931 [Gongronella butleri]